MSVLKCSPLISTLRNFGYHSWNSRFLNKSFLILSGNFCWATVGVWINFLWQWQPWAIFAFLSNFWAKRCLKNILKICQYLRATLSSFVSSYLSRPLLAMIHHILFITHHMTEYSPLNLGPVVRSANPGLNFNLGFLIPLLKSLFGIIFSVLFEVSNSHTLD